MALTAVDALDTLGLESRPILCLAPLRVARDTWPAEAAKWDHLAECSVSAICGTPEQRRQALRSDARVYTCNYDNLPWLVDHLRDSWPFGTVIADESVKIKSFRLNKGGKRAAALGKVAFEKVNRWINLTGYPAPNGLKDLWGQMWFIDAGQRLGRTYGSFMERWFKKDWDGYGVSPFPHSQKEIEDRIRDVTITLDPKDWFDLAEPVVTTVEVTLPPAAMKLYKELEKTMFAELACGTEVEVFNAAALTNKCLQLANGAVYAENGWKGVHDEKLDALESLADEINYSALVAYSFRSDIERIVKRFGKRVALLSGPKGMDAFRKGHAQLGLAHDASLGHGVDGLQYVTNQLIRFGHTWNLDNRLQFLERIGPVRQAQAGFDRPVMVYDIIAKDTCDESVLERHATKESVQNLLLQAMKVRG